MNTHHVYVEQVIHFRYTVELPDDVSPFDQTVEAKEIVRARFEAGDLPEPKLVSHRTIWDFASSGRPL